MAFEPKDDQLTYEDGKRIYGRTSARERRESLQEPEYIPEPTYPVIIQSESLFTQGPDAIFDDEPMDITSPGLNDAPYISSPAPPLTPEEKKRVLIGIGCVVGCVLALWAVGYLYIMITVRFDSLSFLPSIHTARVKYRNDEVVSGLERKIAYITLWMWRNEEKEKLSKLYKSVSRADTAQERATKNADIYECNEKLTKYRYEKHFISREWLALTPAPD